MQWLLLLFQYGPALISLIREIIALFKELTPEERKEAEAKLKAAHADYKLFKDKRPLIDLRDNLKKKCDANAKRC